MHNCNAFNYSFNTGQVEEAYAYAGSHPPSLEAVIQVIELTESRSRATLSFMNKLNGEIFNTHANDVADPAGIPKGIAYIETPNAKIFHLFCIMHGPAFEKPIL